MNYPSWLSQKWILGIAGESPDSTLILLEVKSRGFAPVAHSLQTVGVRRNVPQKMEIGARRSWCSDGVVPVCLKAVPFLNFHL